MRHRLPGAFQEPVGPQRPHVAALWGCIWCVCVTRECVSVCTCVFVDPELWAQKHSWLKTLISCCWMDRRCRVEAINHLVFFLFDYFLVGYFCSNHQTKRCFLLLCFICFWTVSVSLGILTAAVCTCCLSSSCSAPFSLLSCTLSLHYSSHTQTHSHTLKNVGGDFLLSVVVCFFLFVFFNYLNIKMYITLCCPGQCPKVK